MTFKTQIQTHISALPILIICHSNLLGNTIKVALPSNNCRIISPEAFLERIISFKFLIIFDSSSSKLLLKPDQLASMQSLECPSLYLMGDPSLIRVVIAQKIGCGGIATLHDMTLKRFSYFVGQVMAFKNCYSPLSTQLILRHEVLHSSLQRLSLFQLNVLFLTVAKLKPASIAEQLACSVASIYQHQWRLRTHFSVENNDDLINIMRGETHA